MNKIEDLKLIRILDGNLVPRELIEQIKNRQHTVKEFYDFQKDNIFLLTSEGPTINHLNHLYVLVDEHNKIKGVLWFTLDGQQCTIELFSIDRDYWNKGKALNFIYDKIFEIVKPLGIKRATIFTTNPGAYEKIGFTRSKHIMMEIER